MGIEAFRYDGKRVLVVGGATGMGAATAKAAGEFGAEVTVLDIAEVTYPVAASATIDLRSREDVDRTVDGLDGPFDALFSCAGVADGTPGLMLINFVAQRHLFDRLRSQHKLARPSAAVFISSAAGIGWEPALPVLTGLLEQADWDAAVAWLEANPGNDHYMFSKQVLNAYVAREALAGIREGIRINAILPGPTDTPLARANAETWLGFSEQYRTELGLDTLRPEEMADVMVFLGSDAARGIAGQTITVDMGQVAAAVTGTFPDELILALRGTG